MKYNVKKKNSTLEVTIELKEHITNAKPSVMIPRVMIHPRNIVERLNEDGYECGSLLEDNGIKRLSNARWQDAFNLKAVWVFEDKKSKAKAEVDQSAKKQNLNSNKQQKKQK